MPSNMEQIKATLEAMRQQEAALQEQLLMTKGAVQVLEHLISKIEGEGESLPPEIKETVNREQS